MRAKVSTTSQAQRSQMDARNASKQCRGRSVLVQTKLRWVCVFRAIRREFVADVIPICRGLENDFEYTVAVESINFAMKAGGIYKRGGLPCTNECQ